MNRNRNNRPFPNLEFDRRDVTGVAEWPGIKLDNKTNEYGEFIQRTDAMPRAIAMGNKILDLLLFELHYRDELEATRFEEPRPPKPKIVDMFRRPNE